MLPRLYNANSIYKGAYLNHNGLGFLRDTKSCEVTEEKNGEYFLEAAISGSDRLANVITDSMLIKAKPNDIDPPQLFEINKAVTSFGTGGKQIKVSAQHIKYLFFNNFISNNVDYADDTGSPSQIMANVFSRLALPHDFTFTSGIASLGTIDMTDAPAKTLGEIIGGKENSLVSVFNAELHYNNFDIELLASRGHDSNHRIMYGHNISSCEQTLTNDASYSHIVGYAKVPVYVSGSGSSSQSYKVITSTPVSTGSTKTFPKIKQIDFTSDLRNYFGNDFKITGGTLTPGIQNKLNALTAEKLGEYSGIANKDVNIKIDYRPELDRLNNVGLCDTVNVVLGTGSVVKAQVTKVKYDSLAERYKMIEIGDPKPMLPAFFTKKRR